MKTKKTTSKKLKTIAALSAITICFSIGASAIKSNAGAFLSKSTTTASTNGTSFFSRLSSGLELKMPKIKMPKVSLDFGGLGSKLSNGWKKFKGIVGGGKTDKVTITNPSAPTEDEWIDGILQQRTYLTPTAPTENDIINGILSNTTNLTPTAPPLD